MEAFGPGPGTFRPLEQSVLRHAPDERRPVGRRPTGIWQFWAASLTLLVLYSLVGIFDAF